MSVERMWWIYMEKYTKKRAHLSLSISLSLVLTEASSWLVRCFIRATSVSWLLVAPACRLAMHSRREAT